MRQYLGACLMMSSVAWAQAPLSEQGGSPVEPTKDQEVAEKAKPEQLTVKGLRMNLVGQAMSASQGVVSQDELALRPMLRTGDVLELVPGMVVTQHSGTGKANQYFLRGFNLDHGTDFSTSIDGMPINMRTHGHGQGYTDLNFIIPEAVDSIAYKKGAYYADVGDFSGAGSAEMSTAKHREKGLLELTVGEDNYSRLLVMDSVEAAGGDWLYALEANRNDGPWSDIDEDLEKLNLMLKHSRELAGGELSVMLMAYDNSWNSADQIPARAVESGLIDELGSIDDSLGGESSRYSLSAGWKGQGWDISAYAIQYEMNLWSNFTYELDDPINGDQFEQVDDRWIMGGKVSKQIEGQLAGLPMLNRIGAETRFDKIDEVGLYKSEQRNRLGSIRSDSVDEFSAGIFWENQLAWTEQLKTIIGARYDYYDFDVDSRIDSNVNGVDLTDNGGHADDGLLSLKGSVIYTFNEQWEVYGSAGQGFHSNDARGTTIRVDPSDGSSVDQVDPLVESFGYEVGLRSFWNERLNTSIAFWALDLDSELLFVGDAGNTEPSRESERKGVELTAYYRVTDNWTMDVEYAFTDASFKDSAPEGNDVPGAIEQVWQVGISADYASGVFGSLRLRYFGERPLDESGDIKSDSSTVVNLRAGYRWDNWTARADVLNLLDSDDHDIDYYYASQLPGEVAPVEDLHYHVLEPRTVRVSLSYQF